MIQVHLILLEPVVSDLMPLEKVIDISFYYGVYRKLSRFLVVLIGDYLTTNNNSGYCYHSATLPCRFYHNKLT